MLSKAASSTIFLVFGMISHSNIHVSALEPRLSTVFYMRVHLALYNFKTTFVSLEIKSLTTQPIIPFVLNTTKKMIIDIQCIIKSNPKIIFLIFFIFLLFNLFSTVMLLHNNRMQLPNYSSNLNKF